MTETYFTSDHHWGHVNIIAFSERPFSSVEEMDELMIQSWNETVNPEDTVYYLGDMLMGAIEKTLGYIHRLNGKIILFPGNHDKCWQGYYVRGAGKNQDKDYHYWEQKYLAAGIQEIIQTGGHYPFPVVDIGGEQATLSHFPFVGDSHEMRKGDKFSAYRPYNEEQWLIHGHIHNNGGNNPKVDKQINVGVDVWDFHPVHIDWIKELMS